MADVMKIVIDADISKGVAGLQTFGKVFTGEFNKIIGSASEVDKAVSSSIQKINTSLSSLKVSALDVNVNTSQIDTAIQDIKAKFSTLTNPELNILANATQAETVINDLLSQLTQLKGSEIFIRANDSQALAVINQVETELKGILDKQIEISVDPTTAKASIEKINTLLSSLKINSIDTSGVDASIKSIQDKFAALIDPQINVLANTTQAEVKIKELLGELNSLKGSEVFITANDGQALKTINEIEAELKNILDKQINLSVNPAGVSASIDQLKTQLSNLQAQIPVIVSEAGFDKLNADILNIKSEIESLSGKEVIISSDITDPQTKIDLLKTELNSIKSVVIPIKADTNQAITGVEKFRRSLDGLTTGSIKQLERAALELKATLSNLSPSALRSDFGKQLSTTLSTVNTQLKVLKTESNLAGGAASNAFEKAFSGARQLANIIPGLGIGGLIGLAATAVNELTQGFFEAAFGASKFDKALDAAAGSIDKEAGSVITMVKALQSGTLSSSEFKKVKAELIAQAPEFQKTFEGDKISIEASDTALTKYITKLTTTVRVSAALAIVNDTLAKSIATIAKGGTTTVVEDITNLFSKLNPTKPVNLKLSDPKAESLKKALESLNPENVSKLIDETFKKIGISFKDFADGIDDKALKEKLAKIKADFEKFQAETIAKARLFNKEFGSVFLVPDLDEHFFTKKGDIFKTALKELSDISKGNLKIKLPVQIATDADFIFNPDDFKLGEQQLKDLTDRFFKDIQIERNIPVEITTDITLEKGFTDKIDKKLDLRKRFSVLGDFGLKEFNKIDFTNINEGIAEATKRLQNMMDIANTLSQSIGQGLSNAFDNVFDAILQGKSVFKVLGESIKALVVETIKAIAKMFILKLVTNAIFPGAGALKFLGAGGGFGATGGVANLGLGGAIGGTAFSNVLTVVVNGQISGDTIRLAGQRAANSSGRFG